MRLVGELRDGQMRDDRGILPVIGWGFGITEPNFRGEMAERFIRFGSEIQCVGKPSDRREGESER